MSREQNIGQCEHGAKAFSYYLFHSGFSDCAYGYCDRCSYAVILSATMQGHDQPTAQLFQIKRG
jgi:hypothetical protein